MNYVREKSFQYVYLLHNPVTGKWYTGCTNDIRRRLKENNENKNSYTKNKGPYELIYYEACRDKDDAYSREKYLKTGMGRRYLKNRLRRFLSLM